MLAVYVESLFGHFLVSFIIGITTIVLLYRLYAKHYSYWIRKGIPQAKTFPFFGSMIEGFTKPLQDVEIERYKKLGLIYGHYEGFTPVISIADLKLMRNILVKDFNFFTDRRDMFCVDELANSMLLHSRGDDWRRIRSIVSPTFSTGKIKKMLGIFKDCSNTLKTNFRNASKSENLIDIKKFYGAFVTDVIASSAFSTKIDSHNDPSNEFALNARRFFAFTPRMAIKALLFFIFPRIFKCLKLVLYPKDSMEFFTTVVHQIVEERKRTGQVRNDFLQLLLDTSKDKEASTTKSDKDEIVANYKDNNASEQIMKFTISKNLSSNELVGQCIVFFLAGYHTAAVALSITTYFLAIHQNIQDRLRKEILEAVEDSNGELSYESLQKMKYLDNVIAETLRLYPPTIRHERVVGRDYTLGDTGIVLRQGTLVTLPIYAIQRDPKYFPDPERFDPDRFNPQEKVNRDPFSYLPFGAGPRNCIGMRFALMEMKVCLADVVKSFHIKTRPETKIPLEFPISGGFLVPKEIYLTMEPI